MYGKIDEWRYRTAQQRRGRKIDKEHMRKMDYYKKRIA